MIVPPGGEADYPNHRGRTRSRSRSTSRSSRSSLSVDEMLLLATGEGANANGGPGSSAVATSQRSQRRRHHSQREDPATHRHPPSNEAAVQSIQHVQPQRAPGDSPPTQPQQFPQTYSTRAPHASASVPLVTENHPMPAAHHVQTIQTHVFAPVVTGAPQKKNKFSNSAGSVGNLGTPTPGKLINHLILH